KLVLNNVRILLIPDNLQEYMILRTTYYHRILFFFQAEDGIRDFHVTGVQTCALPIYRPSRCPRTAGRRRWRRGWKRSCAWWTSRSEERRVGKECRSRWTPEHSKKKKKNFNNKV